MEALIAIATLPLLALNLLGGIVGFIWLAVLGEWGHIGAGVGAMILMPDLRLRRCGTAFSRSRQPTVRSIFTADV